MVAAFRIYYVRKVATVIRKVLAPLQILVVFGVVLDILIDEIYLCFIRRWLAIRS